MREHELRGQGTAGAARLWADHAGRPGHHPGRPGAHLREPHQAQVPGLRPQLRSRGDAVRVVCGDHEKVTGVHGLHNRALGAGLGGLLLLWRHWHDAASSVCTQAGRVPATEVCQDAHSKAELAVRHDGRGGGKERSPHEGRGRTASRFGSNEHRYGPLPSEERQGTGHRAAGEEGRRPTGLVLGLSNQAAAGRGSRQRNHTGSARWRRRGLVATSRQHRAKRKPARPHAGREGSIEEDGSDDRACHRPSQLSRGDGGFCRHALGHLPRARRHLCGCHP